MSQGGRCRKVGRGGRGGSELDIELTDLDVIVRRAGRVVATLTGRDADDIRAVLDDPEQLERIVARKVR